MKRWLASYRTPVLIVLLSMALIGAASFFWVRSLHSYDQAPVNTRLFVLVSRSLPEPYVKSLLLQLASIRSLPVAVVLRGGPPNGLKQELLYWSQASSGAQLPVWVDPLLYRKYQVDQVPMFLLVTGVDNECPWCEDAADTMAWSVVGATTAEYAVEQLATASQIPATQVALREMRTGFFQ